MRRQRRSGAAVTGSARAEGCKALLEALDRLGLAWHNLAAFGDGDNDREMLKAAGIGIAAANAVPGCKEATDK